MKIVVHSPYGDLNRESGLLFLMANYLNNFFNEVFQLKCNGAFSLCDRDEETSWRREINSCSNCIKNQSQLAAWSNIESRELSPFISNEEIVQTRRLIQATNAASLKKLSLRGINVYELCKHSFYNRFGIENPDPQNKKHEQLMRRIMLSALRMCLATRRFNNHVAPDLTLLAGGQDYITNAYLNQSRQQKKAVAVFYFDMNERCIKIQHPIENKVFSSQLIISDVVEMRSDTKTWPKEIISVIEDILAFLEISEGQITLPLAR